MAHEELAELQRLWKAAEDKLKELERLTNQAFVPSVNELRYAGYHLLRHLREDGGNDLDEAQTHCKRALFDAHEFHIGFSLQQILQFDEEYRLVEVTPIVPDYPELTEKAYRAREFINDKLKSEHFSKEEHYQAAEGHAQTLQEIAQKLTRARPEMNKRLRSYSSGNRNIAIGILIALVIGIATILTTHYWPPATPPASPQQQPASSSS